MKKNFNHITMILTLTMAYNIQSSAAISHFANDQEEIRKHEDEEKTKRTDAEVEALIAENDIPMPYFEDPALWKVLIRQYGIQLVCTCFNFKTWLVQKYYILKEVIYENPAKNETV